MENGKIATCESLQIKVLRLADPPEGASAVPDLPSSAFYKSTNNVCQLGPQRTTPANRV
jgi:hypothetical protein